MPPRVSFWGLSASPYKFKRRRWTRMPWDGKRRPELLFSGGSDGNRTSYADNPMTKYRVWILGLCLSWMTAGKDMVTLCLRHRAMFGNPPWNSEGAGPESLRGTLITAHEKAEKGSTMTNQDKGLVCTTCTINVDFPRFGEPQEDNVCTIWETG